MGRAQSDNRLASGDVWGCLFLCRDEVGDRENVLVKKTLVILVVIAATLLFRSESSAKKLRDLIPGLYGGDGIILADPPAGSPFPSHSPHFTIASTDAINRLNDQISAEIGVFPFNSSVGSFTFKFDPALATFVRTTETLGPIFAERATTLGRGRFSFNASFSYFKYDQFEGDNLNDIQVAAQHQPDVLPPNDERTSFELDTVRIDVDLDIRVWLLPLAATYGITDRLDVGIIVPIVRVAMDVNTHAAVVVSPDNPFPTAHTFVGGPESPDDSASGDATGLGDIVLRAKYHLIKSEAIDLAGSLLVKLATGDEDNFLGTGDTTVRPFLILSRTFANFLVPSINFSPHLNIGYEFNLDNSSRNTVEYVIGFDAGSRKFVFAWELIGSHETNGDGIGTDILTTSVGVKWNPFKQFLLFANALVALNDEGLRADVIPSFGAEYSF